MFNDGDLNPRRFLWAAYSNLGQDAAVEVGSYPGRTLNDFELGFDQENPTNTDIVVSLQVTTIVIAP